MSDIALQHYLAVGAIMFGIGMIGFMTRRNLIVMFLCTEAANYMTGQELVIDGGMTAGGRPVRR